MAKLVSTLFFKLSVLTSILSLTSLFGFASGETAAADSQIEEVVVTGSYIKRKNQSDLASPINVLGLEKIQENGWTDIEEISETITLIPVQ